MEEISIKNWLSNYNAGQYDGRFVGTQIQAGWYDWFCNDSSLAAKTKKFAPKIAALANSPKVDTDKMYVWFKNNCPMVGPLYDSFKFADIESGDVKFCISYLPKGSHGCSSSHWEVYSFENDFDTPLVEGSWKEVMNYFNS